MYGGSGKLGRGRGGGPPNRNLHSAFQPSSVQRPSAGGRQSTVSGQRNPSSTSAAPSTVITADETFSLVRNNPLNFGMTVKLTPVLVEEIKRLEAQGGVARIKFDSSANNHAGNVIDVGGKEFGFKWSRDTGDLCDVYEERRSGDSGDGLLIESGCAWRKLNVQRELDETFKNHVKKLTAEAELEHKSRKTIVLDHKNPSMKTQMKALAAAEVNNNWRGSYKQKKELPFKKKPEPSSAFITAAIPPKSVGKAGFSSSTPSKIRASASPLLPTPEQSGPTLSPLRNNNLNKVHTNRDDVFLTQSSKGNASTSGVVLNKPGNNEVLGSKPSDLQSLLIYLLTEKPHGMNLKALEKAVGETIPKSVKQIEPILKKIAIFQAPGRYVLKPDVDLENFKKSLSESGSSPENNNHLIEADVMKEFEDPPHQISQPYEDLNTSENIDIDNISPDVLGDKKVSHNNDNPAVSDSSDSESDSSDSESDSRSPVGSSSDSDSDASANSKQGSDEDVDIMSDDDIETTQKSVKSQPLDHDLGYTHNMADEKDDGHGSDLVDLEKDLFGENDEVHDHGKKVVSRNTSKRGIDRNHFDENEHVKRLKSGDWARPNMGRTVGDVSDYDYESYNNHNHEAIDLNAQAKPLADVDNRFFERGPQGNIVFPVQKDNKFKETRAGDRRPPKNSHKKKHGALTEKVKAPESQSTSQVKDHSPAGLLKKSTLVNGSQPTLRRELSDLEVGEFRENTHEEKRFFERNNNSFKQSDYWNLDDSLNLPKKANPEENVDDFTRSNGYGKQSQSKVNTNSQRKVNVDEPRQHEKQVVPVSTKDKKRHKSKDVGEKKKDFRMVNNMDKNRQNLSDDSISSYMKYEKEEPEMKGPIRDLTQYNEYVLEYREKYDCYHTLNKILESYRNEFQNFRRDLELAKGRDNDRYNKILEQLMESYRQCGMKHKRLKKIFVVLHHELQHLKEMIRDFADKQTKG